MQPRPRTPSESAAATRVSPGAVHRHEKRADAAAANARLRRGEDDDDVGGLGVRDPDLAAVEHVAALVEASDRLLIRRVGSGVLLRQRKRAERLAASPAAAARCLLRVGSELGDRLGDQRVVDRGDDRDNGAGVASASIASA